MTTVQAAQTVADHLGPVALASEKVQAEIARKPQEFCRIGSSAKPAWLAGK